MLASSSSPNMETGPVGEMSRCWEVDALGLMITTPISTVETRPHPQAPFLLHLQVLKGRAEFFLYKVPTVANNGLVSKRYISKLYLEGMDLD